VADITAFDPKKPAPDYGRALRHVEKGLVELGSAVTSLRQLRSSMPEDNPISHLQAELLESVIAELQDTLQQMRVVIRDIEDTHRTSATGNPPPE
jgi:hypothetical protein